MDELVPLRCPDCGALLLKSSPHNSFPVEIRCRRCKETLHLEHMIPRNPQEDSQPPVDNGDRFR